MGSDITLKEALKAQAASLGFDACGVAEAARLQQEEPLFKAWLRKGFHGNMHYMEHHLEKRMDPQQLLPGARSVIVVAKNYFPEHRPLADKLKFSKYAFGADYHYVIKEQLDKLIAWLHAAFPQAVSRRFTDSAPVLEKAWAQRAGLGWTGKNTCLIIPRKGSFFFLGEIITTARILPDTAFTEDFCGNCSRCIDACPVGAIQEAGILDARKCISCLTIEEKRLLTREETDRCEGWVFGCDVCQDVCPHNKQARPHSEKQFFPLKAFLEWTDADWGQITRPSFKTHFVKKASPLARAGYEKIKGQIQHILL